MATVDQRIRLARHLRELQDLAFDGLPTDAGYGKAFMRTYLPHYMRDKHGRLIPPAGWHDDFDRQVFGTLGTGTRRVYLAPRGYAKSTKVSLVTPLIALARELKHYILLIQETSTQATQAMGQVLSELNGNEKLLADFPALRRMVVRSRPAKDASNDVILATGARMQAVGAGGSLRGRRNMQYRPDMALIDDLEDDEHVNTRAQRDKLDAWLSSAVLGALGDEADVYMVGTLLHHDAVLNRLMKRGAPWRPHTYHAITDRAALADLLIEVDAALESLYADGRIERGEWDVDMIRSTIDAGVLERADEASTWPHLWPSLRLAGKRLEMGSAAFSREYLHEPVDASVQMFPRDRYRYRDTRSRLLNAEPGEFKARVRIAVDVGVGEKKENDYSAVVTAAQVGRAPEFDILSVWRGRKRQDSLAQVIGGVYELWQPYGPVVLVESVQAQAWLAQALRNYGIAAVVEVHPQRDKIIRAEPLAVLYENAQVWHDDSLRDGDFEDELGKFPAGENDDMVDAAVYAVMDVAHGNRPTITLL